MMLDHTKSKSLFPSHSPPVFVGVTYSYSLRHDFDTY
jgi:hypothetical protein